MLSLYVSVSQICCQENKQCLQISIKSDRNTDLMPTYLLSITHTPQVISLTPQGPIGKFACTMRTFSTLSLLHQVLLKVCVFMHVLVCMNVS